jgi:predicted CXXCH cytochrome family protein
MFISCNNELKNEEYIERSTTSNDYVDGYVGDAACVSCHEKEYDLWKGSHHDLAMQKANETTVLGDFNDFETTIDDVSYFFYKKEKDFMVRIKEIDNSEKEYRISYTFGFTPLQQYLVDFEKGKKQVLRVTWDVLEKKWYHQYKNDIIDPNDWMHWTNGAQNWNTMCAECHSTNLKKNYQLDDDSFQTTYSSVNVSCESCHGPAEKHIQWANTDMKKEDATQYIGVTQIEQLNMCAPCHARRMKLTENFKPGEYFEDQYLVQNLSTSFYHGDGQIDEEDYVLGSFMQSKMFDQGVKCTDCHNAHTLKLKFDGNKLCIQCHVPTKYDSENHHFHKENTDASLCINCHMTGKIYMGNDFRRDHSFRIPRPDQSELYGTPNACIECHQDKTNQWATDSINTWYGSKRQDHFSDALLLSSQTDLTENQQNQLYAYINDLNYPEIARSTLIENLSITNSTQLKYLIKAMKDSSAVVRYNAILKCRDMMPQERLSIAMKHMNDTVKLVRIGAAQLLIGLDENTLTGVDKSYYLTAKKELEYMLFSNADFSSGRLQLGDYSLQNNNLNEAIKHYNMALEKDSLLIQVYSNLATAYSMLKDYENADATLNSWIKINPELSRPHYLKALLKFEEGKEEEAIQELNTAIDIDPNDSRSRYNLATYYLQNNIKLSLAESHSRNALKLEPNNQDYIYLLALIYQAQGKIDQANVLMQKLQ